MLLEVCLNAESLLTCAAFYEIQTYIRQISKLSDKFEIPETN
jgi:hypothetical protein